MAFKPLAYLQDLHDGYLRAHRIDNKSLLLIQESGSHYIIENRCPHMDAPLATGALRDHHIICRAHGIAFDLRSGQAQGTLANVLPCLRFYEVVYDGACVGVDTD